MIKVTNDYGHGGSDPGAIGLVVEKDGNLRYGKALTAALIRSNFEVHETRHSDVFVSLSDRVNFSDSFGSSWFISNHEDAGGGHGITVYCYKFGGRGEVLAKAVLKELVAAIGMPSRGVKEGNFQVIRETNCPAILIEFGFVDNAEDVKVINRADMPGIYGDAVTKALCAVCNVPFVPMTAPLPAPQPIPVPQPQPTPVPTPSKFSYPNNAKVVGDDLYIRDENGVRIPGRSVSNGDNITVLDVSYSKQLALVEYPTPSGTRKGYVKNMTSLIQYYNQGQWHNGSTTEIVYGENGAVIGRLNPREAATPIYRKNGKLHVVYNTDKGKNTKSGYVIYNGGFNKF
jgi:hypothetical protein